MDDQFLFSLQFLQDTNGHPHIDKATIIETRLEDAPVVVKKEEKKDDKKDAKKDDPKDTKKDTSTATPPSEAKDATMKDAVVEEKKPEKVKKDHSTPCTIKLMFRNYGIDKTVYDVSLYSKPLIGSKKERRPT